VIGSVGMLRISRLCLMAPLFWSCSAPSDVPVFRVMSEAGGSAVASPGLPLASAPHELFQGGQVVNGCDPTLRGLVGNTPLRRLTRDEYANTIHDLFGIEWWPSDYFPVDTRVGGDSAQAGGFPANDSGQVSRSQVLIYAEAAEEIADAVVRSQSALDPWLGCDQAETSACAQTFIETFGARVFRRKLDEDQVRLLLDLHAAGAARDGFRAGIRAVIAGMLQSPYFLYHAEYKSVHHYDASLPLDPYELAARLSYFLWDSVPDVELWRAASAGELISDEGLRAQAERMIADPRSATGVHTFTEGWLGIGGLADSGEQLDGQTFGEAAWRETLRFVEYVLRRGDDHGLKTLLTAGFSFPEAPLNGVYGIAAPAGYDGSTPLVLPPGERAGVLTQASTLFAMRPRVDSSPPTSRGLYVLRNFLCTNIDYIPEQHFRHTPELQPGQTHRQRLEEETRVEGCNGCHDKISPVGFTFERYDGLGVWRDVDSFGKPIDNNGGLAIGDSRDGDAQGALQLAELIATSDAARTCMVLQMQRFALARTETANDTCSLVSLAQSFSASQFDVRQLMLDLVSQPTFRFRPGS
jgi:hypothetical protein